MGKNNSASKSKTPAIKAIDLGKVRLELKKAMQSLTPWLPEDVTEANIEAFAENLSYEAFPKAAEQPRRDIERQIVRVKTCAANLMVALSSLQEPRAIKFPHICGFEEQLLQLYEATNQVTIAPAHRGRKPKSRADRVASVAASYYAALTGKRPTRVNDKGDEHSNVSASGPFVDFLSKIFNALGIAAKVDPCAKKAIANRTLPHKITSGTFDERFPDAARITRMD